MSNRPINLLLSDILESIDRIPQYTDEFKDKHPEVEWYKVVGLRNRIIHDYFGIDLKIIWQIIHADLPTLRQSLSRM